VTFKVVSLYNKISAYIKISRPINFLITIFSVIVASIICIEGNYSITKILLAAFSGGLIASAGNIINDYFDINIDRINRPQRVLPSGKLKLKEALFLYILLTILAFISSLLINGDAFLIACVASILLFLYSYRIKRILLLSNILVASLTGLTLIYGGIAVNNVRSAILPAFFAFLINFVREIVKDMEDVEGDKYEGIKTLPLVYGIAASKKIILVSTIVLILLTFYPFVLSLYRIEYFILVMILVNPLLVYVIKSIFENDSSKNLNKLSILLKLDMVFGLAAIYLGK
jgi:geranylgeranylglycerol-phosphate geranylgeranyltransferase